MTHTSINRIARIAISAVVVATMVPGRARAQEATTGRTSINSTSAGYLGILSLRCDCTLSTDVDVRKRHFTFRSEPVITAIEAQSPGASVLRRGDVVTHIDGHSLLSPEGARRFASVVPGQTVELSLRRNGRATRARIAAAPLDWNDYRVLGNTAPEAMTGYTVVWGEPPQPAVAPTPAVPAQPGATIRPPRRPGVPRSAEAPTPGVVAPATPEAPRAPRAAWSVMAPSRAARGVVWAMEVPGGSPSPRGWFGFSIRCTDCGWSSSDEPGAKPTWESARHPELSMVAGGSPAARAGLRPGDVLTHIDGVSILTRPGARKFGSVEPGQKVRVTVLRDGRAITRELTLGRRPEARASSMAGVAPARPATPATPPARELRYTGKLDNVSVEVWSAGGPTVERFGDTMVISVGGTMVRLKVDPKK